MNHREMQAIAQNPARVRSLAAQILALLGPDADAGTEDFLVKLGTYGDKDLLSERQREWLWDLRERTFRSSKQGPYRAASLVNRVWENRLDLDEDDEAIIERLHKIGPNVALSRAEWRWIFRILRAWGDLSDEFIPLN
jgi:hypothetical protein